MPQQVKKTLVLSIYFALAVSALLVFWQVRNFDFINYDDKDYVYENPHVLNGLTADGVWWTFTTGNAANWHPLTWLSLMLDCQLFGHSAGRMHLVNLLLHIVNTLLLFMVLKKMTGALWKSAFVAALFALHPLHVESVVWITERKDVLSTFFWLLAMLAYVQYARQPNVFRYLLTLLIFALGLMAKPMLVTLPFVLLLLDYWPFQRKISWRLLIEKIPFIVLSIASSAITFLIQNRGGSMTDIDALPFKYRIANVFLSYARYIGKMFWPSNLAIFYPFDAHRFPPWQIALCVLFLFVVSIGVFRLRKNHGYLSTGWFWFVVTLIPAIGIIQVGRQAYADRYTYIPYIGLFIMLAWSLPRLLSKWPQRKIALGVSMMIVLTVLGICAHRQTSFWKNSFTLFSHALEVTQNNYMAYDRLGVVYDSLGRGTEAIDAYKQSLKIKPDYAEAYNNLGIAYGNLGRGTEEIDAYKQAIRLNPDYADVYYNLGIAYGSIGRYAEAIDALRQTIKINPDLAGAHYNLGVAYGKLSRPAEAIEAYKQAIRVKPDYAEAYNNLGIAYSNLGRYEEAINALKRAIKIKPDYANAHFALGFTYLSSGDKHSAMEEYEILKTLDAQMANNLLNQINK
jgi:Flp pilus assembly protein TadD/4-amino-4-deoxy-L-arabinose transferase-like glycosyltransferase